MFFSLLTNKLYGFKISVLLLLENGSSNKSAHDNPSIKIRLRNIFFKKSLFEIYKFSNIVTKFNTVYTFLTSLIIISDVLKLPNRFLKIFFIFG